MLGLILGFLGLVNCATDTTIKSADSTRVVTVNRILIIGNKITKDRIISRELSLKSGDTISLKRLAHTLLWDKRKIYNLRLFHTVNVRSIDLQNGMIDLLIEVSERWYIFPIPIFELSDRNFSEWWHNYNHDISRVNYGLDLTFYNFRGRNEMLHLIAQFGFTERFQISYRIPYIDKKQKQGLAFNIDYSAPKNLAYSTENLQTFTHPHVLQYLKYDKTLKTTKGASVTYSYRKSFFETHNIQIGYRVTQINDTIAKLNSNYFGDNRLKLKYANIGYSFNSEHRDVVQYPLRGYQLAGFVMQTGLGFGSSINMFEAGISYARHFDLTHHWFLSNYTGGYLAMPTNQPYALYSGMGRIQYVRGFENYVIETPAYAINKTTLKKRIFYKVWSLDWMPAQQLAYFPLSIYIKTYADWGYAKNYPYYEKYQTTALNTSFTNKLIGGYGAGLDFYTVYDIVIRCEYTFTNQQHHGFFLSLKKEF